MSVVADNLNHICFLMSSTDIEVYIYNRAKHVCCYILTVPYRHKIYIFSSVGLSTSHVANIGLLTS